VDDLESGDAAGSESSVKIKGYVVRGTDDDGRPVCAARMADDERPTALVSSKSAEAHLFGSLSDAAAMCRSPMWNEDVRIYAVAEDGTETPLPTYEEALAEVERLRGEVEAIRGQRDAFRDHLDLAYRNANAERAETERLQALLAKVFGGEAAEANLGQLVELAAEELTAIDHAVAEAGIDTCGPDDTLPARVGRLIEDANEVERGADAADDILERIIDAWRADGAIDGALIEEAEALLGVTPEADPLAC
jgi:hypothetical protein